MTFQPRGTRKKIAILTVTIVALVVLAMMLAPVATAVDGPARPSDMDLAAFAAMEMIAGHTKNGPGDRGLSLSQMEALIAQGRTLRIECGLEAELGVRALLRLGIPARLVAAETLDPTVPLSSGGHTLLEAYLDGHWQVFDIDWNVKPVTPEGNGLSIGQLVYHVQHKLPIRFERVASDWPQLSPLQVHLPAYHGQSPYRAVLQQPLIYYPSTGGFVYTTPNASVRSYMDTHWLPNYYGWLPKDMYDAFAASPTSSSWNVLGWP
jgi:hypothetical protein